MSSVVVVVVVVGLFVVDIHLLYRKKSPKMHSIMISVDSPIEKKKNQIQRKTKRNENSSHLPKVILGITPQNPLLW
jgi:dephospho-CoA kinase